MLTRIVHDRSKLTWPPAHLLGLGTYVPPCELPRDLVKVVAKRSWAGGIPIRTTNQILWKGQDCQPLNDSAIRMVRKAAGLV
jgi:hypothetical protein